MLIEQERNPVPDSPCLHRSRKANRRTLKGCITQAERIQQQIRNVGMQYVDVKPVIFKSLHSVHEVIDELKKVLAVTGNDL